ncbi:MAG: response regulator transcription factor [Burkholderiaceae bacterium]|nr:response regulator transcription factor [Burkholderiaceae bacterium]
MLRSQPFSTRIFLADDHQMFREALCHLLQTQTDMEVVGQTGDGAQVLDMARQCSPDVVCMDISMPGMQGPEVTRQLLALMPQVKVVALSAYADQPYVLEMLQAGACGYVTKAEASDELLRAIRTVLQGRTYLCPDVAGVVAGAVVGQSDPARPAAMLGARERQVLKLVAEGCTSVQIADLLGIAPSTVEVHRRNIMRKLDRHSVAALTRYVVNNERGLR